MENGEFFQTLSLPYQEGERYPRLERDAGSSDWIEAITKPLAPVAK